MAILALFATLTLARKPSPAGGGCLDFNGVDNFAVCRDNDSLDKNLWLNAFTIEAWIYPRRKPEKYEWWIIAGKPNTYEFAFIGFDDRLQIQSVTDFGLVFKGYWNIDSASTLVAQKGQRGFPADFKFNRWHHVAVVFFKGAGLLKIYVDKVSVSTGWVGANFGMHDTPYSLYVGGIEHREGSYFDGCIDELLISVKPIVPDVERNARLNIDRKTSALWHFDENEGAVLFRDASRNGNTLVGKGNGFPVASAGKLTTTWVRLKNY
jgi:hypothetical protein